MVALSISSHEQTHLNQLSMLFSNIVDFLFLKDPFTTLLRGCNTCLCFYVELVKFPPSIDIVLIFFHILVLWEH